MGWAESRTAAGAEPNGDSFDFPRFPTPHPPFFNSNLLTLTSCLFSLILPGTTLARAQANVPLAVPIDGEPFEAQLAAVDQRWQITFQTPAERRVLPAASLVSWGKCAEADRGPLIVMDDGSLMVAEVRSADREHLSADSGLFGLVRFPRKRLAGVIFHVPADREGRDRIIDRIVPAATGTTGGRGLAEGGADRALLVNGDEVAGTIERIADGKVRLQSNVGPLELEISRLRAIVLRAAPAPRVEDPRGPEPLGALIGLRDGTRLRVSTLVTTGDSLQVTLPGGIVWNTAAKELVFLQPLGGPVVYLSDLKPEGYRHVPFLNLTWPYRADRNVAGGMLRGGGTLYLKGLGMHSASRLTYALGGSYRRFQAELAVDDQTDGRGSVGFRVFIDGQVRYTSPIIRGGQPPTPVSVDLTGAKRIDLVVDFADRADECDHANWLNARLVR